MMMCVLVAVPLAKAQYLKESYAALDEDVQRALRYVRNSVERYRRVSASGTTYLVLELYTDKPAVLSRLDAKAIVLGAWRKDGLQVGQEWERYRDAEGRVRHRVVGVPTYPIHPRLADAMPNGDVHRMMGWAPKAMS